MKDKIHTGVEGYFKIECIKDGKVSDVFEDHNTIMISARRSMAELFINTANTDNGYKFANRFVLGTEGCTTTEYVPKTEATGFTKDKTNQCLYSEEGYVDIADGDNILTKYKVYKYNDKYYRYIGTDATTVTINSVNIADTNNFINVSKPYTYAIDFSLNKTREYVVGTDSNNLVTGDSITNRCKAKVEIPRDGHDNVLEQSTVEFTFTIPKDQANGQHTPLESGYSTNISAFTEAGLYVNGRLFSMKCFPSKIKDDSTEVKVTWRIIF